MLTRHGDSVLCHPSEERSEAFEAEEGRFRGQLFAANPRLYSELYPAKMTEGDWISGADEEGVRDLWS